MDWDWLRIFYHVAASKSFTKAAQHLNISQSSLSRTIQSLENRLNIQLFFREKYGLKLTPYGTILYEYVRNMFSEAEAALAALKEEEEDVKTQLCITSGYGFAEKVLSPHAMRFAKQYPNIKLSILCSDFGLDFKRDKVDVAIRSYKLNDPNLIQEYLFTRKYRLFASKEYLKEMGEPKCVEDLDHHRLLSFSQSQNIPDIQQDWHLTVGRRSDKPRESHMDANSVQFLYDAAISGQGIGLFSEDALPLQGSNLKHILLDVDTPSRDFYFIYPKALKGLKKIVIFQNFLQDAFKDHRK